MSFTLFETFQQVDPYVKFTDGSFVATAQTILTRINPADLTEYVLSSDAAGRLIIYRLDLRGRVVSPPAFVEEKTNPPRGAVASAYKSVDFGSVLHGYV